jgi:hypothetical protein
MTDLEMTRLCAEAIGLSSKTQKTFQDYKEVLTEAKEGEIWVPFDPINDDKQVVPLVWWLAERGVLSFSGDNTMFMPYFQPDPSMPYVVMRPTKTTEERRHALVELVAKTYAPTTPKPSAA